MILPRRENIYWVHFPMAHFLKDFSLSLFSVKTCPDSIFRSLLLWKSMLKYSPPLHSLQLKRHAFNISPNPFHFSSASVCNISTKKKQGISIQIHSQTENVYLFALRIIFTIIYYYNFPFSQPYTNTRHTVQIFLHEKVTLGRLFIYTHTENYI